MKLQDVTKKIMKNSTRFSLLTVSDNKLYQSYIYTTWLLVNKELVYTNIVPKDGGVKGKVEGNAFFISPQTKNEEHKEKKYLLTCS